MKPLSRNVNHKRKYQRSNHKARSMKMLKKIEVPNAHLKTLDIVTVKDAVMIAMIAMIARTDKIDKIDKIDMTDILDMIGITPVATIMATVDIIATEVLRLLLYPAQRFW
jgi:hypothetical protein